GFQWRVAGDAPRCLPEWLCAVVYLYDHGSVADVGAMTAAYARSLRADTANRDGTANQQHSERHGLHLKPLQTKRRSQREGGNRRSGQVWRWPAYLLRESGFCAMKATVARPFPEQP